MKNYRVKLRYIVEFDFFIQAETEQEAEQEALKLMEDSNPGSSDYYWYDSEIEETKIDNISLIDNL